jgi:TonB family protein
MKMRSFLLSAIILFNYISLYSQEINARSQSKAMEYQEVDLVPDSIKSKISFDRLPMYPKGMEGFYSVIRNNIRYPREALKNKIAGDVIVSFVVTKEGAVADPRIKASVHQLLDNEVIRLFSNNLFAKWQPAMLKNEEVEVRLEAPVRFYIDY